MDEVRSYLINLGVCKLMQSFSWFSRSGFLGWVVVVIAVFGVPLNSVGAEDSSVSNETAIEMGITAIENKNYVKAFSLFVPLAEAGNAEAQHNLAMLYRTGKGTQKDIPASYVWFRRAAEQGISDAQYYLGYMYDGGEGVKQDPQYAYVWYRKAAEQGHGLAQINLGFLYANGEGVTQNIDQAYLWFHVSAAQGYKVAFENKTLIEEALEKEDEGAERLESLKKRAREYFGLYVLPFGRPPASHRSFKAPKMPQGQASPHSLMTCFGLIDELL